MQQFLLKWCILILTYFKKSSDQVASENINLIETHLITNFFVTDRKFYPSYFILFIHLIIQTLILKGYIFH